MKKILLIALVLAITITFVLAAFQAAVAGPVAAAGSVCPNVGWNSRGVCVSNVPAGPVQPVAALLLAVRTPNVGWNS